MNKKTNLPSIEQLSDEDIKLIVYSLYLGFLNRRPDNSGFEHFSNELRNGAKPGEILNRFLSSIEYKKLREHKHHFDRSRQQLINRLKEMLPDIKLTIVDIGAANLEDEEHVYEKLSESGIPIRVIGFEPNVKSFNERNAMQSAYDLTLLPNLIGDGEVHSFNVNYPSGTSSILPLHASTIERFTDLENIYTEQTISIKTTSLDDQLQAFSTLDLLKLDIQGYELSVLRNSPKVLTRTLMIQCEVSFIEIYENQPLFREIDLFLNECGFDFVDFCSQRHYSFKNASNIHSKDQMSWGDAVYLKRESLLLPREQLLVQALISLILYGKYSLASFLVERYINGLHQCL